MTARRPTKTFDYDRIREFRSELAAHLDESGDGSPTTPPPPPPPTPSPHVRTPVTNFRNWFRSRYINSGKRFGGRRGVSNRPRNPRGGSRGPESVCKSFLRLDTAKCRSDDDDDGGGGG